MHTGEIREIFEEALGFVASTNELIRQRVTERFETERKSDTTFVTSIDLEVEKLLRDKIMSRFPSHGIIGEEFENTNPGSAVQWVIDPIDGTQNLVLGIPTIATIVGIHVDGEPIVGLIDHPLMNIQIAAARGHGTRRNGERVTIDNSRDFGKDEVLALSTRGAFGRSDDSSLFDLLHARHENTRIYYDCLGQSLAAQGSVAAMIEVNVKPWDLAAAEVLIEEAGGTYEKLLLEPSRHSALMGSRIGVARVSTYLEEYFGERAYRLLD